MFQILDPAFKSNPYPFYAQLRAQSPVFRMEGPNGRPIWLITDYELAAMVLKDPRFAKDRARSLTEEQRANRRPMSETFALFNPNMLSIDPPDHTRLRALVQKAFTPRLVESMRVRIQAIADELIDRVQAHGEMELIADFAFPLPITVIGEILGIPDEDRTRFREWSGMIIEGANAFEDTANRPNRAPVLEVFVAYLRDLFALRRTAPGDDLISGLLQTEIDGQSLDEAELYSMVFLLLIAGHETTVNLITNGTLALLTHPDQFKALQTNPDLLKSAVEEFLRYESPVEWATFRWTSEPVELNGQTIPQGEMVLISLSSANRDPNVFADPDALDLTREKNPHLAFGLGVHYCLGAPLARLEGQIAFGTLIRRLPNLRLKIAPDALQWRSVMITRGLEALPVTF